MSFKHKVTEKYFALQKALERSDKSIEKLGKRPFSGPLGRAIIGLISLAFSLASAHSGATGATDNSSKVAEFVAFLPDGLLGTLLLWGLGLFALLICRFVSFGLLAVGQSIVVRAIRGSFNKVAIAVAVYLLTLLSIENNPIVAIIVAFAIILYSCYGAKPNIYKLLYLRYSTKEDLNSKEEQAEYWSKTDEHAVAHSSRQEAEATRKAIERRVDVLLNVIITLFALSMIPVWVAVSIYTSTAIASAIVVLALDIICEIRAARKYPEKDSKIKMLIDVVEEDKLEKAKADLEKLREANDTYEIALRKNTIKFSDRMRKKQRQSK